MPKCLATRNDGNPCGNWSLPDSDYCRWHGSVQAFTGRRWEAGALCLEEANGACFLCRQYTTEDEPAEEKILAIVGNTTAIEDERITSLILGGLLAGAPSRAVYSRTPELRERLRHWLSRVVVTMADGRRLTGADLADRTEGGPPAWDCPATPVASRAPAKKLFAKCAELVSVPLQFEGDNGREACSYEVLPHDSSRISMQAVQALSRGREMQSYGEQWQRCQGQNVKWSPPYWKALSFDTTPSRVRGDWLRGMIGFTEDPGEAVWETLVERGALAVQAHFVLWARALQQRGPQPDDWITLTTNDFCDDLGYARLSRERGHQPERRREAYRVFRLLTKIELHALYFNKKQKPARMLHGGIWVPGLSEERQLADAPEPQLWVPSWFRYQPGDWFHDPQWREWNQHLGVISRGFLGLNAGNQDKWAVLIGGYLGSRAPVNDYAPLTAKVETICEATGMAAVYLPNHKGAEMVQKLERALDRLETVGVLAGWEYLQDRTRVRVFWPDALQLQRESVCDQLERLTRRQRPSRR